MLPFPFPVRTALPPFPYQPYGTSSAFGASQLALGAVRDPNANITGLIYGERDAAALGDCDLMHFLMAGRCPKGAPPPLTCSHTMQAARQPANSALHRCYICMTSALAPCPFALPSQRSTSLLTTRRWVLMAHNAATGSLLVGTAVVCGPCLHDSYGGMQSSASKRGTVVPFF